MVAGASRFSPMLTPTPRLRGRAAVEQRKRRMARTHGCCERCEAKGVYGVRATVVDHIVPLAMGGPDTDENTQNLCAACDYEKTSQEDASHQAVSNHPTWLRPSTIPLTIVCGPPASGKSMYVRDRTVGGDVVIDLDEIAGGHISGTGHLNAAIRQRNAMLGVLSRATTGRAWFIVGAPTEAERSWWKDKLGGCAVVLDPGEDECLRRIRVRGTLWQAQAVKDWYRPKPWVAPQERKAKQTIAADGWPE